MQIGIDVGATKIESVVLEDNGSEHQRSRISCPKEYEQIVKTVKEINDNLEKTFNKTLPIGVCHPGIHSPQTGLVKNAPNCYWLEKKPFQQDLRKLLNKEVILGSRSIRFIRRSNIKKYISFEFINTPFKFTCSQR